MWPERYPMSEIERLQRATGPNKFASQMMLRPVNTINGRLDPTLLRLYDGDIAYIKELKRLEINNTPMRTASAWWDPAFGVGKGDRSVLAICYQDENSHYWLQHLAVIQRKNESGCDVASDQCAQVAALLKRHMVPSVAVEMNGVGTFLPGILRKELSAQNVPCSVLEVHSHRPKDIRILEAFDVVMAAERLHVHRQVMTTPFATELSEWRPGRTKGHDDCLDAVAGALSMQPARLGSYAPYSRQVWTKGAKPSTANTDFKV